MTNYENKISVKSSPRQVFDAPTDMSAWGMEKTAKIPKIGNRATSPFDDGTTRSFAVIAIEEDHLVEMHCYEANHIHPVTTTAMQAEWKATLLRFTIHPQEAAAEVRFTHIGLTPEINCYGNVGWDHFLGSSLKSHLDGQAA